MAELCRICNEKMYVGEAYSLYNSDGTIVGYVHRECLFPDNERTD